MMLVQSGPQDEKPSSQGVSANVHRPQHRARHYDACVHLDGSRHGWPGCATFPHKGRSGSGWSLHSLLSGYWSTENEAERYHGCRWKPGRSSVLFTWRSDGQWVFRVSQDSYTDVPALKLFFLLLKRISRLLLLLFDFPMLLCEPARKGSHRRDPPGFYLSRSHCICTSMRTDPLHTHVWHQPVHRGGMPIVVSGWWRSVFLEEESSSPGSRKRACMIRGSPVLDRIR